MQLFPPNTSPLNLNFSFNNICTYCVNVQSSLYVYSTGYIKEEKKNRACLRATTGNKPQNIRKEKQKQRPQNENDKIRGIPVYKNKNTNPDKV